MRGTPLARSIIAAALPILACNAAPAWDVDTSDTITLSKRHSVCDAVCANYDVTVAPDGAVASKWLAAGEAMNWPVPRVRSIGFRVSPAEAARFRAILRPYRPADARQVDAACGRDLEPLLPRKTGRSPPAAAELRIAWRAAGASLPLLACDRPGMPAVIDAALRIVHLKIDEGE